MYDLELLEEAFPELGPLNYELDDTILTAWHKPHEPHSWDLANPKNTPDKIKDKLSILVNEKTLERIKYQEQLQLKYEIRIATRFAIALLPIFAAITYAIIVIARSI